MTSENENTAHVNGARDNGSKEITRLLREKAHIERRLKEIEEALRVDRYTPIQSVPLNPRSSRSWRSA